MRNWANSLLALLVATSAAASPDQSVSVRDSLFARTDDHVLILRQLVDNQGSYYITQTDTILLTISLADGTLVEIAPVERARETHIDLPEDATTYIALDGAVNPYTVRAARGAAPLADPLSHLSYRGALLVPTGLLVFEGETLRNAIPLAALQSQITTSVVETRNAVPPAFMLNGYDVLRDGFGIQFERDCTPDRTVFPHYPTAASSALVRLNCDDQYDGGHSIYWVVVPPVN